MRYVIVTRRSAAFEDGERVAIRMRVDGGWSAERDGENGLVHLIEHMPRDANGEMSAEEVVAFRDEETIVREWGAFTSPYASEYYFTTRTNSLPAVTQGLRYFRGAVSGLRLTDALVGRQRQIVLTEMAPRAAQARRLHKRAQILAPGSEWDVSRGYNSSDVATASLATIRDLYARLYRPENITIILAGDLDQNTALQLVRDAFGALPGYHKGTGSKRVSTRMPDTNATVEREVDGEPLVFAALHSRAIVSPSRAGQPFTPRQADLLDRMIALILSHRLDLHALENGLSGAQFTLDNTSPSGRSPVWQAGPVGMQWRSALAPLLDQIAAARAKGFSAHEVAVAKSILLREIRDAHAQALRYSNMRVAGQVSESITKGYALEPEGKRFAHDSRFLEAITEKSLNNVWSQIVGDEPVRARLEGFQNDSDSASSLEQSLLSYVRNYTARPLPTFTTEQNAFENNSNPLRGAALHSEIVSDTRSETGIRSLTLRNGSTLRLIKRAHDGPYLEMAAYMNAPSARGRLSHCEALVLPHFVTAGGSAEQSEAARRDAMWGKQIRYFPFETTPTGLRTGASVRIQDADIAIMALHSLIARPAFRETAQSVAQARSQAAINNDARDLLKPIIWTLERQLAADQFAQPAVANAEDCKGAASMAHAARLLAPILTTGSIDLAIAGNMDEDQLIELFAGTFGQDKGRRAATHGAAAKAPAGGTAFASVNSTFDLPADVGGQELVARLWAMNTPINARERATQELFTALLARMVYIKLVEQGSSYAPRVERIELMTPGQPPILVAAVRVQRGEVAAVSAALDEVTAQLAESGPTQELLEIIRRMMIEGILNSYNQDRAWAYQSAQLSTQPNSVRIWRNVAAQLKEVRALDIQILAQRSFAQPVTNAARKMSALRPI